MQVSDKTCMKSKYTRCEEIVFQTKSSSSQGIKVMKNCCFCYCSVFFKWLLNKQIANHPIPQPLFSVKLNFASAFPFPSTFSIGSTCTMGVATAISILWYITSLCIHSRLAEEGKRTCSYNFYVNLISDDLFRPKD